MITIRNIDKYENIDDEDDGYGHHQYEEETSEI